MALLLTVATGAWAQDPDPIDLTPSADGTVWTLSTMPEYDIELEVTYYTDAELDQMAADEVIAKITAIGTVTYTPESKALIDAARTAYDALTAAQQALVTNYSTLTDAETTYATAEETAYTEGVELTKNPDGTWTLAATPAFDVELEVEYYDEVTLTDGEAITGLDTYKGQEIWVNYTRSFTADKPSTVCLPFAYTPQGEEKFYSFTGINEDGGNYTADMTEVVTPLVANTPYLFMPTGDADFSGTYAIPASITAGSTISGDWTFKGTYSTIEWTDAPAEPTYGFSAQDANAGITQGQFVKVGSYVRIKPMRAYLQYNGSDSQFINARSLTRAAATTSDDTLPETIGVRLISANGEVTAIGTLYTRTGEVSFDSEAWYTLDGKRLNAKPNTKGIYVNNGKKVVIK